MDVYSVFARIMKFIIISDGVCQVKCVNFFDFYGGQYDRHNYFMEIN